MTFEVRPVNLPVVIALHPGKLIGRRACNVIASIYAKDFAGIEGAWRTRGLLLWAAETKKPRRRHDNRGSICQVWDDAMKHERGDVMLPER